MVPYVEQIIKIFPEELCTSTVATPTTDHIFQVRNMKEAKLVQEEQAIQFHHTIAHCS